MLRILVVGGYDSVDENAEDVRAFCAALGGQIIRQGHAVLNACQTDFDADVARAAHDALRGQSPAEVDRRLVSFVLSDVKPAHDLGRVLRSRLLSWDTKDATFVPEPVKMADAVIMVRGFDGAKRAAWWARYARKPLLPVASFQGASKEVFEQEINDFESKYGSTADILDYQGLNSSTRDWAKLATAVIADLTELKQNVFFELGFARGLGKRVIVTAKEGTALPFDVKDIPVTFWKSINPKGLREKMVERIRPIADEQGHT